MKTAATLIPLLCLAVAVPAMAQIDPEPRKLLHVGFNQPLKKDGPNEAYAFFYWNIPEFPEANQTLRMVFAPTFVTSELGFRGLLGAQTDLAVEVFGGGFYNSYDELRRGDYIREESFTGHGGGINVSVYHLFNPGAMIPLSGVLRGGVDYHLFTDNTHTADTFELPDDQPVLSLRVGLRFGGREPVLWPRLGSEISVWYEVHHRPDGGRYGFADDRELNPTSHRFLGRLEMAHTLPESKHRFGIGLIGGGVLDADRFSAYGVGGALPFTSEFPLYMPGYFHKELSTERFGLLYGTYTLPLDEAELYSFAVGGATGWVDYVDGLEQPGQWHSGVGGTLGYTPGSRRWRVGLGYNYGFNAIRDDDRGGHNVGFLFMYNFGDPKTASDRVFDELLDVRTPRPRPLR
jgi:hypothetical protein